MSNPVRALAPLRHACLRCGASCQGVLVRPVSAEEAARVEALGARLGIDAPIEGGRLRRVDGACAFLTDDGLCRIHLEIGPEAKPQICRSYPMVLSDVGDGLRAGIDPGCLRAAEGWRRGPTLEALPPTVSRAEISPAAADQEIPLLQWSRRPGASVGGMLQALGEGAPGEVDALPPGFAGRWIAALQRADLPALLARPELGRAVPEALAGLGGCVEGWAPAAPPGWPALDAAQTRWALEVLQRCIFLRLIGPVPVASAALVLGGAVACGWAAQARPGLSFEAALSAWTRLCRAPMLAARLLPDPEALLTLLRGAPQEGA